MHDLNDGTGSKSIYASPEFVELEKLNSEANEFLKGECKKLGDFDERRQNRRKEKKLKAANPKIRLANQTINDE